MADVIGVYSEALSMTMQDRSIKKVFNQYIKSHPAFDILKSNFASQPGEEGGMLIPVKGYNTVTTTYTDRSGTLVTPVTDDNIGTALYDFKNPELAQVRLRWIDLERNTGRNAIESRLKSHQEDLDEAFRVSFITKMHQDDSARAANDFLSLDSLTNEAVTNVGLIDTSSGKNAFWNPLTVDATGKSDPKLLLRAISQAFRKRTNGHGLPKVVLAGDNFWNACLEYLDSKGSLNTQIGGNAGDVEWDSFKFEGTEVRYDYEAPADRVYLIEPSALEFKYLNGLWMKPLPTKDVYDIVGGKIATTQDRSYQTASLLSVGTNERRRLGQIRNFGA